MKINIKEAARQFLSSKIDPKQYVFISLDDGSTKFSKVGGSCAIGNKFQLVISDKADNDYNVPVENNAGYQMFTSDDELEYIGAGLNLDYKDAALVLGDNSGVLDGAVGLVKAEDTVTTNSDKENFDNKIC